MQKQKTRVEQSARVLYFMEVGRGEGSTASGSDRVSIIVRIKAEGL